MDRQARIEEQLAEVPLFSSLSKKEIRQISQLATPLGEPTGAVLVQEGRIGHEFIIVLEGEIEIRKGDQVIATRRPGSYIGEIALIDHRPRTATVVATTPVSIEVIGQLRVRRPARGGARALSAAPGDRRPASRRPRRQDFAVARLLDRHRLGVAARCATRFPRPRR